MPNFRLISFKLCPYVRDGNLVTAGGVMSGIEMSLWLVGELYSEAVVQRTKNYIAYDFPPRDSSDVSQG